MENWFSITQIDENTFAISEHEHWEETNCYLLIGEERALLIDTGLGVENIYEEVCKLSAKPVIAVPTHVHWDHIGGLKYFQKFYVHEAEEEWINGKFPLPDEFVRGQLVKFSTLPESFEPDSYTVFRGKPEKLLKDGDIIDIGKRRIEVVHTPGHSPGHMCFYEKETGYFFSGDLIYKGTLFADYPSTDPQEYLESAEKTAKLDVKKILPAHHEINIDVKIISEVAGELGKLKKENKLCHGSGKFVFDGWSIMI